MLKDILLVIIFFLLYKILLKNEKFSINQDNNSLTNNNFVMDDKSIIMSMTKRFNKDECLSKINNKDINGASYNLKTNECLLYFFANKGATNENYESQIGNV